MAAGVLKQTQEWDATKNATGFTTGGGTALLSVPTALPTADVAGGGVPTLDYVVRFTLANGTVETLDGGALFPLLSASASDQQTLNVSGQTGGTGAGKITFDPLTLSFAQSGLTPELLTLLTTGAALKEVDVLGYTASGPDGGQLVTDESFGLVGVQSLSLDNSGVTTATFQYGSEALVTRQENPDGSFGTPNSASWDRATNTSGFSTTASGAAGTFSLPTALDTEGTVVAGTGTNKLDYYVRFTLQGGQQLMVGEGDLFRLTSFSFEAEQTLNIGSDSGGAGAGKASFDPLSLAFADPSLAPLLFQLLASGTALQEVDVLGYTPATAGAAATLSVAYSFGLVGVASEQLGDNDPTQLTLEYGSEAVRVYAQGGTPTSTQDWNATKNASGFTTGGGTALLSVPTTLPSANVAGGGAPTLNYVVRFTLPNGTVETLNAGSLFPLLSLTAGGVQTLNIGNQSSGTGAGKITFDPLTLSFAQSGLTPELLTLLTTGAALKEVDVLGYTASGPDSGQLVTDESFGLVGVQSVSLDDSGVTTATFQYGSEAIAARLENPDGSFGTLSSTSWDRVTNTSGFSTTASGAAGTFSLPTALDTEGTVVAGTGKNTLDYYVRFTLQNGQQLTVSGNDLFQLSSFSFGAEQTLNIGSQSAGAGAGKASFDPLSLAFADPSLAPNLFQMLAAGIALKEVDVLGYTTPTPSAAGTLSVAYSFGLVGLASEQLGDNDPTQVTLDYGSEAVRTYTQGGTPTTQDWDATKNASGFNTGGGTALLSVPTTLPTADVAGGGGTLDYVVRFTLANGTVETLDGGALFPLLSALASDQQTLNVSAQTGGTGAGKIAFDPLTLSFAQSGLTPELLALLTTGAALKEVDVLGYTASGPDGGQLVTDESFGLVGVQSLSLDNSGVTTATFQYGSEALVTRQENPDGSFGTPNSASWDRETNTSGFSTTASGAAGTFSLPTALDTEGTVVAGTGTNKLDYYVRFTEQNGQQLAVSGDDLFRLSSFSFGAEQTLNIGSESGGAGAGKASFDPLSLAFADANLAPNLFQMLAAGIALKEVDVLGYTPATAGATAPLSVAYSFGLVGLASEQLGDNDPTQVTLNYGSEAVRTYDDTVACYCEGTSILAEAGERTVESLAIGDLLPTVSGTLRPIRWIGRRSYAGHVLRGRPGLLPVCFKAGSLAEGVPHRDLCVSPKHAMYIDGMLIAAEHLVNGTSVVRLGPAASVTYVHIELESHDAILAEGAWSETFVDDDSRAMFHNAREFAALYPGCEPAEAAYFAPRVDQGFALEAVRRRMAGLVRQAA